MTARQLILCALVGPWVLASARARADAPAPSPAPSTAPTGESPGEPRGESPGETIVIVDRAPDRDAQARDRDRALGDAPFISVLHPDEHPAAVSVADAVATAVGAHTRSLGGLGAYASVTVRGAAPGHTAVLIDGVPLARIAEVTTDLGRYTLDAFGQVDLYRGAVPVELGGAGVGGALNLITRLGRGAHGERITASAGGGSFGARHARVRYGDRLGDFESSTTIGYAGATGDYRYYDDNSTPLNRNDDHEATRGNNGFDAIDGATRWATLDRRAVAGARVAYKRQGLPGSMANPASDARLSTVDGVLDGSFDLDVADFTAHQAAYALVEHQRLRDPRGELGLGTAQRSLGTYAGGASSTWRRAIDRHRLTAGAELRAERFRDHDDTGAQPTLVGHRLGGAVTAAAELAIDRDARLVITPALRFDALRTKPTAMTVGPDAFAPVSPRWDSITSPRVTGRLAATDDVSIKASAGWYARLPTLTEVFGNRGYVLGSPDLRAERGPSADIGAVWAPARGLGLVDRIFVSGDVFAHRAHDTIAFVPSGGFVMRAANIGDTQAYGAELVAAARFVQLISLTASYTRLVTEQTGGDPSVEGKPVPREPGHALVARGEVAHAIAHRDVRAWLEAAWQGTSFLDPANLGRVPSRALYAAGARVELGGGVGLALAVANLADLRIAHLPLDPPPSRTLTEAPTALTDVAGYPLPGRSFDLTLDWTY